MPLNQLHGPERESRSPHGGYTADRDAEKQANWVELSQDDFTVESDRNGRTIRGFRWLVICITCFLYGLNTTIAADVHGPVIKAFGHVEQFAWIGAGFPLG
ncbi:hypothetical protein SI65_08515 [Aspergillus cristatus]|uniref:Major facilitator superfamily (MFS) profile domain-containing protein n=1 Tax=Aspergillus cristatus TaxID=573508 RepID=A0A1E3B5K5_ASPCR|nr:hypothetical protein SI65_08515 [Aspergillus cristatus]